MISDESMRQFIDSQLLVYCESKDEIRAFMEVCDQYDLQTRLGESSESIVRKVICFSEDESVTFIHNYRGPHDGISYWNGLVDQDRYLNPGKKVKTWKELIAEKQDPTFSDLDSVLN